MKKILIVDDDPSFNSMLTAFLRRKDFDVSSVHSSTSALSSLRSGTFDLVLTDFKLPDMDGLELIRKIKRDNASLPVILITNYSDIRTAVASIKLGAYEFVSKPVIPEELLTTMQKAMEVTAQPPDLQEARGDDYIVGENSASRELWHHVDLVARTNISVLITGESGTGKEHVARILWQKSQRSNEKFVAIDCGALSPELAASELFGHVKGAFTGATHDKKGQFEIAHKGTIFLDEVGNLPYSVQVQLLRAIQERTIRKIGSDHDTRVDVRIISATNEALPDAIRRETFRNDLFHRLNEFELKIPPLRERVEDLEKFISFFRQEACRELDKRVTDIDPEAMSVLARYSWPGNLRELKNIIKRATLLCPGTTITVDQLPQGLANGETVPPARSAVTTDLKAAQQEHEREMIIKVLQETKYNKTKAAALLNIDRTTLYVKIKQYDIDA